MRDKNMFYASLYLYLGIGIIRWLSKVERQSLSWHIYAQLSTNGRRLASYLSFQVLIFSWCYPRFSFWSPEHKALIIRAFRKPSWQFFFQIDIYNCFIANDLYPRIFLKNEELENIIATWFLKKKKYFYDLPSRIYLLICFWRMLPIDCGQNF